MGCVFLIVFWAGSLYLFEGLPPINNAVVGILGLLVGDAIYSGLFGFDNLKKELLKLQEDKIESCRNVVSESHKELLNGMKKGFEEKLERYWTLTLKDILGKNSRMFQGLQKSYLNSLNKRDLIEDFLAGGKVGFCFMKKCDLHEYGNWANIFVDNAKESIFATSFFYLEDFFNSPDAKFYRGYFEKFKNKDLPNKKRLQIISDVKKFISNTEHIKTYKELNENIMFRWIEKKNFGLMKMGDYLIIDGIVVLRYDPEDEILELLSGEVVEQFLAPFGENYFKDLGTWDTL